MSGHSLRTAKFEKVIQLELNEDDKGEIVAWELKMPEAFDTIAHLARMGYQVALSYDDERERYSASVYGKYRNCPNAGLMVFGNATNIYDALKSVLWKTCIRMEDENWHNFDNTPSPGDIS